MHTTTNQLEKQTKEFRLSSVENREPPRKVFEKVSKVIRKMTGGKVKDGL